MFSIAVDPAPGDRRARARRRSTPDASTRPRVGGQRAGYDVEEDFRRAEIMPGKADDLAGRDLERQVGEHLLAPATAAALAARRGVWEADRAHRLEDADDRGRAGPAARQAKARTAGEPDDAEPPRSPSIPVVVTGADESIGADRSLHRTVNPWSPSPSPTGCPDSPCCVRPGGRYRARREGAAAQAATRASQRSGRFARRVAEAGAFACRTSASTNVPTIEEDASSFGHTKRSTKRRLRAAPSAGSASERARRTRCSSSVRPTLRRPSSSAARCWKWSVPSLRGGHLVERAPCGPVCRECSPRSSRWY